MIKATHQDKADLRIAVAKDVLTLLDADKIVPTCGVYLQSKWEYRERTKGERAKAYYKRMTAKPCEACALGSIFLAATGHAGVLPALKNKGFHTLSKGLVPLFGQGQLNEIEHAFEYDQIPLRAIMENIIENEGTYQK